MKVILKLSLVVSSLGICNLIAGLRINQATSAEGDDNSLPVILGPRRLGQIDDLPQTIPSHSHVHVSYQANEDTYDNQSTLSSKKSKQGGGKKSNRGNDDNEDETDRYVIMFKEGSGDYASKIAFSTLRAKKGTKGGKKKKRRHKKVLKLSKKEAQAWEEREDVDYIETDRKVRLLKETKSYGLDFVTALYVDDGEVSNRKVCIIDSGYDYDHPDLPKGSGITGESGSSNDPWNKDDWTSHGTHVAGIITSIGGNNIGTVGVIRNGSLQLHIVRIFRNREWIWGSDLVSAVEACVDAGANIVNMSLGAVGYKRSEEEAFEQMLEEDNLLLISAAGNDGTTDSFYPASYDSVISVGAIDDSRKHASFSQKNENVDLVAPGVEIKSTKRNNRYGYYDGTSMAAAYVSGVAALVWSHFPEQSAKNIRSALLSTAHDLGREGKDDVFGHGLLSASRAYSYLKGDECTDAPGWYDSWGKSYDCLWYSYDDNCEVYGDGFENFEMNANQACCLCGGGIFDDTDDTDINGNDDQDEIQEDDVEINNDDQEIQEDDVETNNDDQDEIQEDDVEIDNDDYEVDADDEVSIENDDVEGKNDDNNENNIQDDDVDVSSEDDIEDIIQDDDADVSNDDQDAVQEDDFVGEDVCKDVSDWFDSWGSSYDCNWYAIGNRCHDYGSYFWNKGHTALTACCACKEYT